jgi:hypothetical protein
MRRRPSATDHGALDGIDLDGAEVEGLSAAASITAPRFSLDFFLGAGRGGDASLEIVAVESGEREITHATCSLTFWANDNRCGAMAMLTAASDDQFSACGNACLNENALT